MVEKWASEVVAELFSFGITHAELAEEVGWHPKYLSAVLNGRRYAPNAEARINDALGRLIQKRGGGK